MAAEPLWTLDRVSLDFARLCAVSLQITPGVTAVVGAAGAGKTALLNLLAGFERPQRGQFLRLVGAKPQPAAHSTLAWVPQNGGLWPHCTTREHLTLARGSTPEVDELLEAFDLRAQAEMRPDALSRGEQSCLAVARALAAPAKVLVMDEPLAHVDPNRREAYWRVIREHLTTTGASLIFSTREPETVLAQASRVVGLRQGQVIYEGQVGELYATPPTMETMHFLGPGNWLSPEEARLWLGLRLDAARCFRPEQIEIEPAPVSHIVVRHSIFQGSLAETELRQINAATLRTFLHRPSGPHLSPGTPAVVRFRE